MNQGTEDRGQGAGDRGQETGDSGHPFGCALELTEDMGLAEHFRQQWQPLVQPVGIEPDGRLVLDEVAYFRQPVIHYVFSSFCPWRGGESAYNWNRYDADDAPARQRNEVWTPEEIHTRTARRIDSLMLALEDLEQQARLAWSVKCLELIRKLERRHRREIRIRLRCLPGMELLDPINS